MRYMIVAMMALGLMISSANAAQTITVTVPDMVCENCAASLTHNFEKQKAVASVQTDIPARQLALTLKEKAALDDAAIKALVTDSGFTTGAIAR